MTIDWTWPTYNNITPDDLDPGYQLARRPGLRKTEATTTKPPAEETEGDRLMRFFFGR